jgi:hypothetical protein
MMAVSRSHASPPVEPAVEGGDEEIVALSLEDIRELFVAPDADPLRGGTLLGITGIDYAANQVKAGDLKRPVRLVIGLPAGAIDPGLVRRTGEAVRHSCDERIRHYRNDRRAERREAIAGLRFSVSVLATTVALSVAITHAPYINDFSTEFLTGGLSVLGWVAMWSPIQALVMPDFPTGRDIRAYQRIAEAEITIQAQQ